MPSISLGANAVKQGADTIGGGAGKTDGGWRNLGPFGAGLSAGADIAGGLTRQAVANAEAKQMRTNATQQFAAGTQEAQIQARRAQLVQSAQVARAGASGSSGSDASVQNVTAETGRQGEYNALGAVYAGKSAAQNMEEQALMAKYAGRTDMGASVVKAFGTVANARTGGSDSPTLGEQGLTLFDRFAGKVPYWFGSGAPRW